jgi:hypothetical protein
MILWLKRLIDGVSREPRCQLPDAIVTDWDIAQAFEQREPEIGCVEYRFLGVTGEEDA